MPYPAAGPFIAHRGFRPDRKDEIKRFIGRFLPDFSSRDLNELAVYREVMDRMMQDTELPLRSMANRLLARAELLDSPAHHMGMGLDCYSNCTSPLRLKLAPVPESRCTRWACPRATAQWRQTICS